MRYLKILLMALTFGLQLPALAAGIPVTLFKNPNCTCCNAWAKHLEANGFKVQIVNTTDLASISRKYGVPENLEGCHTALVDGYVVEGLVPVRYIKRLLKEHPLVKGIALPGMPLGVPGMPGTKSGPLNIYYVDASAPPRVFASF
ncbi:DUF411 domain-containing protein [Pandoraea sp.]|uniref:DUF411 domain-containing protein n=1 Tax=Pandoraea sp. TaxID=1883445 RepID=UPI0012239787|nr:DUF411 domain-containing protein [Pandoraea sp.]TAL55701.1 MAG: DUF411 domain-containing protein [Pandoraea sp.]TAM14391.1 MAG: DUF411 domain-containing protein [Pandoraea sp.]